MSQWESQIRDAPPKEPILAKPRPAQPSRRTPGGTPAAPPPQRLGAPALIGWAVIALLGLSFKPNPEDIAARKELDELHRRDNDGAHS